LPLSRGALHAFPFIANARLLDIKQRCNIATELRDNTDLFCSGAHYASFLQKLVPVLSKLLEGPPNFMSTSWEHVSLLKLGHASDS